jgi:hypothetical protein
VYTRSCEVAYEHAVWRGYNKSVSVSERKNLCGQKWERVGVCWCVGVKHDVYYTKSS